MKKTNLLKKFASISVIGAGIVISLVSPNQAKALWNFNSFGNRTTDTYNQSGPGYRTTSRIGNMTIDNYYDNYGSISCTTSNIGFMTTVNCY